MFGSLAAPDEADPLVLPIAPLPVQQEIDAENDDEAIAGPPKTGAADSKADSTAAADPDGMEEFLAGLDDACSPAKAGAADSKASSTAAADPDGMEEFLAGLDDACSPAKTGAEAGSSKKDHDIL
jgi:hypothetical protein